MCGIAGIVSNEPSGKEIIQGAVRSLRHRGPEGNGMYESSDRRAVLGHTRLCIIDLSDKAAQPMAYLGRYQVVFNGELYNYLELKNLLKSKGYLFSTESDTEVVVAAYAAFGNSCLQQFDGMFAFAIWDEKEGRLFAARDRFGEKPFFYSYHNSRFLFASEMKALWQMGVSQEVNSAMVYNFLTIGYTSNPGNPHETFYTEIDKLPAASWLHYSPRTDTLEVERYWQVVPEQKEFIREEGAIEEFDHLFTTSVSRRLRSDVPVGTSLSGGLDSSSIVAWCHGLAAEQYSHHCFTATFPGFERDEAKHAAAVAEQYHLEHHLVEVHDTEIVSLMHQVMKSQEEPIASASPLAQYKVYSAARQSGITVLLDGQGADEILGGYSKFYPWYWLELYKQRKLGSSGELPAARALGVQSAWGWKEKIAALAPELASGIQQSRKEKSAFRHPALNRDFAFRHKRRLYHTLPAQFTLNSALHFNTSVYGLEELLRFADRNSMAHSVEVRLPFLYHKLVEFLFTLPPGLKIHQGWSKWLLRKSGEKKLPSEISWRKDKVGFEPPQERWMQRADVQEAIGESKKRLVEEGILDASVLTKSIQPHGSHAAENWDWKFWSTAFLYQNKL